MANISYIRVLQAIELFSKEHLQVKRFASDFPGQMPNFGTESEAYPIVYVSPTETIFNENTSTFQIDVYCFDVIQKDRENINTILSDTNLILSDLHRWLLDGDVYGLDIINTPVATPIDNALLDYVAGWRMTIILDCSTYGVCEIPFINEPVILTEINDVVYTTYLTCATLGECDTFTDAIDNLQEQIDNIELTPGPTGAQGATGATGPQGATGEGAFQDLQSVTDYGNSTTNPIISNSAFDYDYGDDENYGFLGHVQDKEYSEFAFYTVDQSDDSWGTTRIFANPETGIEIADSDTGGSNTSSILLNQGDLFLENTANSGGSNMQSRIRLWKDYTNLYITNLDTTESNTIDMYTNRTYTKKYITTDEGFEGNYLQLNTAATETSEVGKFNWNDTDGTVDLGLKGGNVTLQIGQESVIRVVNKTATNITLLESNYQAVRITGAQGNRLKVDLAQATTDTLSAETIGLVTETIANNQEGFITTSGLVRGINTTGSLQSETWADGDILYLSPAVAGRITNVKPQAPNHLVIIGYVVRAHITQGQIFVKVDNGYELDELHNVKITGATGGEVLTFNGSTQVWENKKVYNDLQIRRNGITIYDDLLGTTASDFFQKLTFNSGGWSVSTFSNENNPGVIAITSSVASASSGGSIIPASTASPRNYAVGIGMQFDLIMRTSALSENVIMRFGIIAGTTNATQPANGVYLRLNNNDLVGQTANGSVRSQTSAYTDITATTWYHFRVKMVSSSLAVYELYNMDGALLWTDSLTTNLPNIGEGVQPTFIAYNQIAEARQMCQVDYISFTYPPMNRGALI